MPNVVNLANARRRRTCWSSAIGTAPASSRMCSTTCAQANLNVQETENIVFEGAEAAVARINLDGAPAPPLCDRIKARTRHSRSAGVYSCERPKLEFEEALSWQQLTTTRVFSIFPPVPRSCRSRCSRRRSATFCRCRRRHVDSRDQPSSKPFDEIIAGLRGRSAHAGGIPKTTTCCSCRAARACSSRWCR